jgi:hypothetical protein
MFATGLIWVPILTLLLAIVKAIGTEQVPNKLTEQFSAPLLAIVKAIGTEQCSLKVKSDYKQFA